MPDPNPVVDALLASGRRELTTTPTEDTAVIDADAPADPIPAEGAPHAIQTTISTSEIENLIHQYLDSRTSIYIQPSHTDGKWKVDGDIDLRDLALWISAEVSPCPCNCDTETFTGRWTSGSFTGGGALVSAYTCEEHSPLVAAWCHLSTGIAPVFVAAPAGGDNRE